MREVGFRIGLIGLMIGVVFVVVGLMFLAAGGRELLGVALAGSGLVLAGVAAILIHQQRLTPEVSRKMLEPSGRRDRDQRQRRAGLFMMAIQFVAALALGLPAALRLAAGGARLIDGLLAMFVVMMAWFSLVVVQGWDGGDKAARKYLEEEWTRVLRASAMTWGYVALLTGLSVVYAISLWRPDWTPVALALALAVGGAVPALRFAFMDKAADAEDE